MSLDKHETLANDFLQMVDNQELSDVILVCEDGVELRACRMVLAARSWYFRQLLLNGMAESRNTSIALPTVSSPVLAIVLKFLYAEVLLDEDILPDDVFCQPLVCVESIEGICFHLLQIMVFFRMRVAALFKMSRKAFHFYFSNTQRTSSDEIWDWSLEEYLRLREVITWCAVSAAGIEDLDRNCLPGPEIALKFLEECDKSSLVDSGSIFDFSAGRESFVKSILKEDLNKFLQMVNLGSIHPELLVAVIEPLNVIDPLDFARIYSVQAMRGSRKSRENAMHRVTHVWHWAGCGLYPLTTRCSNNLTFTVSPSTPSPVLQLSMVSAVELKMEFSLCTFEWEIHVTLQGDVKRGCMRGNSKSGSTDSCVEKTLA